MRHRVFLIGWVDNGVVTDATIATEFPLSERFEAGRSRPIQVVLGEAYGQTIEQAERDLMTQMRSAGHNLGWLAKMPRYASRMKRRGTVVAQAVMGRHTGPAVLPPSLQQDLQASHIPIEWIQKRVSLSTITIDPVLLAKRPDLMEFVRQAQPDDEIWLFDSPPESWQALAGRRGLILVRNGRLIHKVLLLLN